MNTLYKILCLHGYYQNVTRFSSHTGSLRKILKDEAELYYLSAPNKIPGTGYGDDSLRAWWFSRPNAFSSTDETYIEIGLKESLDIIIAKFKEEGPFHGILGFSQGASLVGLLCAMKEANEIDLDFKFAILFSGFKSQCLLHTKYYSKEIKIPSLHVIGETDEIIPTDMSYKLADVFVNPVILLHPGGHFVPGRSIYKKDYIHFLQAQRKTLIPPSAGVT